jgi:hypothetical protein
MDIEIEMFRRHLREMLALLEDPEFNTESLRELKRYWLWHNDYDHETISRHTPVAYPHKHIVGFSIIRSGRLAFFRSAG